MACKVSDREENDIHTAPLEPLMRNYCLVAILILTANRAAAQTAYIRVLVPVFTTQPAPGAYGSLWESQFAIHNGSSNRTYDIMVCPPGEGCLAIGAADQELLPGETQMGFPGRYYPLPVNAVAGAVLYLTSPAAGDPGDNISFDLRIVDLSRSATAAGTEVPVVRDRDFYTSNIHLLNIPIDARFRLALRLFEMNLDRAQFAIRIFDQTTNGLLAARTMTTTLTGRPGGFTPAFAEIADLLSGVEAPPSRIRVQIEPLTAGGSFWAYVSITNNESQQITLVTPQ